MTAPSMLRPARAGHGNVTLSLPRFYPRRMALAVIFIMTTEVFFYFPGMSAPNELWNVLCFLFICFVYLAWKAKSGERFMGMEFYILAIMGLTPLWTGFMAQYVFGQPAFYGILAERSVIVGTGALALVMFYRWGWINSEDCRVTFLFLAWTTLVLYAVMTTYVLAIGSETSSTGGGGLFTLNYVFIQIGFFYYGLIGFNKKSMLHYALAVPFLVYIISTGQRAQLLCTIGAYGLFILLRGSFSRLIVFVPSALIGAAALIGAVYVVNPSYVTDLAVRIAEATTAVATGQRTEDVSANARLEETATALPYISSSPWMGNGDLSNKWHGGYTGVLNAYFYPADVGIIGVLYRFGILGVLFFALQFWWMRKYAKAASCGPATPPMVDAVSAFLIAYAVISLESGFYATKFPTGALLLAFLYIAASERKKSEGGQNVKRRYPVRILRGLQRPS